MQPGRSQSEAAKRGPASTLARTSLVTAPATCQARGAALGLHLLSILCGRCLSDFGRRVSLCCRRAVLLLLFPSCLRLCVFQIFLAPIIAPCRPAFTAACVVFSCGLRSAVLGRLALSLLALALPRFQPTYTHIMAGLIDPTVTGKYPVVLGDNLLGKTSNEIFTGVRCTCLPPMTARLVPGADPRC